MRNYLLIASFTLCSPLALAHNAPFPHAEMHHEVAHLWVHALFALPIFIMAGVAYKLWQRSRTRNDR